MGLIFFGTRSGPIRAALNGSWAEYPRTSDFQAGNPLGLKIAYLMLIGTPLIGVIIVFVIPFYLAVTHLRTTSRPAWVGMKKAALTMPSKNTAKR